MSYTLDSKTFLGFSDFIPANSAADWTTWEDWGSGGAVVVVVCVGVGVGGEGSHFKIKGCGGNACPPTIIFAYVLPTVACSLDCLAKANPDGILLIFNATSVRNSLEANSELRCKCISNFSVTTPRVHHRQGYRQQRGKRPFYSAPRST